MRTLQLQGGDLVFDKGALQMVEGPPEVAQSCRLILGTRRGEWFLNPELGLVFDTFLGKNPDRDQMEDELRAGIAQEPRIQMVDTIEILAKADRTQTISFTATAQDGAIITEEVEIDA